VAKPKLFIVNDYGVGAPWYKTFQKTSDFEAADAVCFTGGQDISPTLYGEVSGHNTHGVTPSRDQIEVAFYKRARDRNMPMIGICRGAQLLCAMAGGKLVQDMRHPHRHFITTDSGGKFLMNSLHHQMMLPLNTKHRLIAWCDGLSDHYEDGVGNPLTVPENKEPEIVYFEDIKGLAVQGHPEWLPADSPVIDYLNKLAKELFFK
jgi:putative glutamine amidotransferase